MLVSLLSFSRQLYLTFGLVVARLPPAGGQVGGVDARESCFILRWHSPGASRLRAARRKPLASPNPIFLIKAPRCCVSVEPDPAPWRMSAWLGRRRAGGRLARGRWRKAGAALRRGGGHGAAKAKRKACGRRGETAACGGGAGVLRCPKARMRRSDGGGWNLFTKTRTKGVRTVGSLRQKNVAGAGG